MQANGKYLKDESGNIISPIVSINTIYNSEGVSLLDLFYPVGSYYETSDSTFNPNTTWGGTWTYEDTIGYTTVAGCLDEDDYDDRNTVSGSSSKVLGIVDDTTGEKTHTLTTSEMPSHTHSYVRWGINITNCVRASGEGICATSDPISYTSGSTGGGEAHNNVQPSIFVIRWHRTA